MLLSGKIARFIRIYLSQLMGNPVLDSEGEKIGSVSDLGIATGEVFPRITSLAFISHFFAFFG